MGAWTAIVECNFADMPRRTWADPMAVIVMSFECNFASRPHSVDLELVAAFLFVRPAATQTKP